MRRIVVAIYIDPDFFPPTINAVLNLAEVSEEVIVISRNNTITDYPYPANVHLKKIGKFVTVRDLEKQPVILKVTYFLQFTWTLFRYSRTRKTSLLLLYDHFAIFSFYLMRRVRRHTKVWYHNHDITDKSELRKVSIGSIASRYEKNAMRHIDFFSLPSAERLLFYPDIKVGIPVFIIPNYPSLKVYKNLKCNTIFENKKERAITIIYQGFIGPGHGLEQILELTKEEVGGNSLILVLKGSVTNEYRTHLQVMAEKYGVSNNVTWIAVGPYAEVPAITATCDIGIGINTNTDNISLTQGTASNKIYEYAASGLPVILNDSEEFRKYLDRYKWVFFTDGSVGSLRKILNEIIQNLTGLSNEARSSFEEQLNFEHVFSPVIKEIFTAAS